MKRTTVVIMLLLPGILFLGCGLPNSSSDSPQSKAATVSDTDKKAEKVPAAVEEKSKGPQMFEPGSFEGHTNCDECHRDIYEEWSHSMHAYAWDDKWYRPDYILAHQETDGLTDMLCGGCHAPIAARTGLLPPADGSKFDAASRRGISCDFCHTVTGVANIYNMGHISEPGDVKRGPRGDGNSLYHEVKYSEIHTKADFCGSCHMVISPISGVDIIDTWKDWKNNDYGKQNITCQDCHMTPSPGVTKSPGRAALMGKERENIAFHGFIGGNSYVQEARGNTKQAELSREFLRAAAEVKLAEKVAADGTLELTVDVHNVGAGHKIPTGTTYIRIIWIQIEVADSTGKIVYSSGQVDEKNHVDPNAVFFRVLFRDAEGNLTGKSWRARSIGYDRRIPANGKDSETYRIPLPNKGEYKATARLMYRSFTQATLDEVFERTGQVLPPVTSVEMAAANIGVQF